MWVYISINLILFLLIIIDFYQGKKEIKVLHFYMYTLVVLFLILFVGLRECGFDYDNYKYYYKHLTNVYWRHNSEVLGVELGYTMLNYISPNFHFLLLLISCLTVGIQFIFIYRYSPLPFFSVVLLFGSLFFLSYMGQYRQALAMSFVLWASIYKDKKILFITLIAIGTQFHVSSLIAILLLFIPEKYLTLKQYIIILIIALVSNIVGKSIIVNYIPLLPDFVGTKLDYYIKGESFTLGINSAMLLRLIIFGIFYYNKDKILKYNRGVFFFNIYFLSLFIYLGLGFIPQLGGRSSFYFYFFEIILAAIIIKESAKLHQFAYLLFFISISIIRQISFFTEWSEFYIPYKNTLINLF